MSKKHINNKTPLHNSSFTFVNDIVDAIWVARVNRLTRSMYCKSSGVTVTYTWSALQYIRVFEMAKSDKSLTIYTGHKHAVDRRSTHIHNTDLYAFCRKNLLQYIWPTKQFKMAPESVNNVQHSGLWRRAM